jgi:hypothetical protein
MQAAEEAAHAEAVEVAYAEGYEAGYTQSTIDRENALADIEDKRTVNLNL